MMLTGIEYERAWCDARGYAQKDGQLRVQRRRSHGWAIVQAQPGREPRIHQHVHNGYPTAELGKLQSRVAFQVT